eukprot:snap_masked-scaffold866_size86999-processed-gene-0.11 protein:Tk02082 transcript:snap_masked-scaffold866_size86999-processed-gene-0.11-mRNA-1 annotation:"protein gpr107-like"
MGVAGWSLGLLSLWAVGVCGRKHHLSVEADGRRFFPNSIFGFYAGGFLGVNVSGLGVSPEGGPEAAPIGFTLDRSSNDALNPHVEASERRCLLTDHGSTGGLIRFELDFAANLTRVHCSEDLRALHIFPSMARMRALWAQQALGGPSFSDSGMFQPRKGESAATGASVAPATGCAPAQLPLSPWLDAGGQTRYNLSFVLYVAHPSEAGLYSLYFHNCRNYERTSASRVDFTVDLEEKNGNSYLSAGEMPLPALYLMLSVLFCLSGCFWVFILRKNGTERVFRIHWVMAALVYLKALSLFFHGINYQKIEFHGHNIESWAILYYVTHLLKGGLLFFTLILIGSGWAFVKHIFSGREKRVFIMVLPLQVLANVAYIIVEESEQGDTRHNAWREILTLVDLLCCGAILFPVVWSIRHLQESSQTDGKATISLEKLKLFRHFYIMVVCYIYFTRIIVYLLQITVPYQYEWLDEMFKEMATFVFFVMTGYKFRPASDNPYFSVPTDDYDLGEVLVGSTGIREQVSQRKGRRLLGDEDDESDDDEGMVFFPHEDRRASRPETYPLNGAIVEVQVSQPVDQLLIRRPIGGFWVVTREATRGQESLFERTVGSAAVGGQDVQLLSLLHQIVSQEMLIFVLQLEQLGEESRVLLSDLTQLLVLVNLRVSRIDVGHGVQAPGNGVHRGHTRGGGT